MPFDHLRNSATLSLLLLLSFTRRPGLSTRSVCLFIRRRRLRGKAEREAAGGETAAAAPVAVLVTQKAFWKKPKLRLKCHRKVSSLEAATGQQLSPITPRVHVAGPRNVHVSCCAEMTKSSNSYESVSRQFITNCPTQLRAILSRPAPNAKCAQPPKIEKAKRSLSLCVYKEASF